MYITCPPVLDLPRCYAYLVFPGPPKGPSKVYEKVTLTSELPHAGFLPPQATPTLQSTTLGLNTYADLLAIDLPRTHPKGRTRLPARYSCAITFGIRLQLRHRMLVRVALRHTRRHLGFRSGWLSPLHVTHADILSMGFTQVLPPSEDT